MSPLPLQLVHVDPTLPPADGDVPVYHAASQLYRPTATSSTGNVTAAATLTNNQIVLGQGTHAVATLGALGTTTTVLHGNAAGAPSFGAVNLTADVTGTLPAGNGGTGITSLGTGVATWLGTPSSANLISAVTDETGTGALVFANTPTLVTPVLGTPTSGTLTNCTGLSDGGLALTDVTTNNVNTSKHGFAPKGDGDTSKFLNANGAYSSPSASAGGAMSLIETATPSGTGTFTFSSLGSFTHLKIIYSARGDQSATATNIGVKFNADGGAHYDQQQVQGQVTTASASQDITATSLLGILTVAAATAPSGACGAGELLICDYRGTTFDKAGVSTFGYKTSDASGGITYRSDVFFWRDTSAITSITLALASGNYVSGSKFSLYGIS